MSKSKNYNLFEWGEFFEYSEASPSGLVWKIPRAFNGGLNYDRVGKPVGSKLHNPQRQSEYWCVGLGENNSSKIYLVHRIIWVLLHGSIAQHNDVDHIDQNGLNNISSNLREVSKSINAKNKRMRKDNKTGLLGVSFSETKTSNGYRSQFTDANGKLVRKYFSIKKYGEDALLIADQWRKDEISKLNGAEYGELNGSKN